MDYFLQDDIANYFPEMDQVEVSMNHVPDFPLPDLPYESKDFNEKVKKLIEELDSFKVKMTTMCAADDNLTLLNTDLRSNEQYRKCEDYVDERVVYMSSSNLLEQTSDIPVLEANNLESLLEKFEATAELASQKENNTSLLPLRKCFTKSQKKCSILIPPITKQKSTRTRVSGTGKKSNPVHIDAKSISSQGTIAIGETDHDYCFNSFGRQLSLNESVKMYDYENNPLELSWSKNGGMNTESSQSSTESLDNMKNALKSSLYGNVVDQRNSERQKIIYVGKIPSTFDCNVLKTMFSKYGEVVHSTIFLRKHGDNYGFVTFKESEDAARILSLYKSDPSLKDYDLCYGARRTFCKRLYSDLDSKLQDAPHSQSISTDFDSLLQDAKAKMARKV